MREALAWALAFVVLAPLAFWAARRLGGGARGGLLLASMLLGIGEPLERPPAQKVAAEDEARPDRGAGDPPALG